MKKLYLLLALISFIAISCGPSINPALQQKVGTYFNKTSNKSFTMSGGFNKPIPYAVGQWVEYGSKDGEGKRSINKTSIVGKEAGGWIIEYYNLSEYDEQVMQMLVKGLDNVALTGDPEDVEIVWIKIKDEKGQPVKYEEPFLSVMKGMYKHVLNNFSYQNAMQATDEDVQVPAGIFKGASKIRATTKIFGKKYETDGWFHKDVPINGMVKSRATDNTVVMELLDFGMSGASSQF